MSVFSVVEGFLEHLQNYSDADIQSILQYLPNSEVCSTEGVVNLLMELVGDRRTDAVSKFEGQSSIEESPKEVKHKASQKRKRAGDEGEFADSSKVIAFVCPKEKDYFSNMDSVEDLVRYKESDEYQNVIRNQTVARSEEGRKLIRMVEEQDTIFQLLAETLQGYDLGN